MSNASDIIYGIKLWKSMRDTSSSLNSIPRQQWTRDGFNVLFAVPLSDTCPTCHISLLGPKGIDYFCPSCQKIFRTLSDDNPNMMVPVEDIDLVKRTWIQEW